MNLRPIAVISGILILGVVAALVALWFAQSPADRSQPNPGSPLAASSADAFRAGFLPLLEQAAADAQVLVALGESRERNLLRIRAGQEAMSSSLAAADAWLASHQLPAPDEPAIAAYHHGAAAIRTAMSEAQAGFLRFDFERVGRATVTLRQGAADLARAVSLLQEYASRRLPGPRSFAPRDDTRDVSRYAGCDPYRAAALSAPAWLPPALGTGLEREWLFANHQDQRLPAPGCSRD